MADIVISGNTSGAVTLRAPDVSGTTLLTLPTTSGTIVTTAGATSLTTSGNLTFTGTGNRITGDFSNNTVASRVCFQTSTANSNTNLTLLPTGTGSGTFVNFFQSGTDPTNSTTGRVGLAGGAGYFLIESAIAGGGAYMPMIFATGGSERLRIDTSGNVGIGGSPSARLTVATANGRLNSTTQTNEVNLNVRADQTKNCGITFTEDAIADRWTIGCVNADQSFIFRQNASSMTTGTERMRLTGAGDLLVGTTANPAKITTNGNIMINAGNYNTALGVGLTINAGAYADTTTKARVVHVGGVGDNNNRCGWTAYSIKTNNVGNGAEYYIRPVIFNGTAFTEQGSAGVYLTDNATSWTSASDERLKENLQPIANAVEKVKTIRAVTGKYKADTDGTSRAFLIAQDVQAVLPEAVTENSEGYLGLAYTETIPLLVAAIKEQQTMIQELKARIDVLEGAK